MTATSAVEQAISRVAETVILDYQMRVANSLLASEMAAEQMRQLDNALADVPVSYAELIASGIQMVVNADEEMHRDQQALAELAMNNSTSNPQHLTNMAAVSAELDRLVSLNYKLTNGDVYSFG